MMGLAGVSGTWLISRLLQTHMFSILIVIPLVMAVLALLLIAFGGLSGPVLLLLMGWRGSWEAPPASSMTTLVASSFRHAPERSRYRGTAVRR